VLLSTELDSRLSVQDEPKSKKMNEKGDYRHV